MNPVIVALELVVSKWTHIFPIYLYRYRNKCVSTCIHIVECGIINPHPQNVHILMQQTCEWVILHGKKDFTVWLSILEWENYPGFSGWAQYNHWLYWKAKGWVRDRDVTTKAEVRKREGKRDLKMLCYRLWKWKKGPRAKECRPLLEARKGEETDSVLSFQKEHGPADMLILGLLTSRMVR